MQINLNNLSLRTQSKCVKLRTRETPNTDPFLLVCKTNITNNIKSNAVLKDDKNGTVLEQSNETTLPMHLLQSLRGHLFVVQSLLF